MEFKFIANACGIFKGSSGTKVLCDPWLKNGVFEGSWFHYPPIKTKTEDVLNIDAIYVSHLHSDHFDIRTFKKFKKSTPIIILDREPNFLLRILKKLGFKNIIKIKNNKKANFKEFEITMYEPWEKHNFEESELGNLIDSSIILKDKNTKKVAINFNDNIPSVSGAKKIKKIFKDIDLALVNYNAAGPYPSCFDNLNKRKKVLECKRIINRNLNHTLKIVNQLKPKLVMPFAGSYVLAGKHSKKNNYLGSTTPLHCVNFLKKKILFYTKIFCLNEGQSINLITSKLSKNYQLLKTSEKNNYMKKISKIKYEYELDKKPELNKLKEDINIAKERLVDRIKKLGIKVNSSIFINLGKEKIEVLKGKRNLKLECELDLKLLRRILDRKSHWNNAEVGAHVAFKRIPNKADMDAHTCMSFFHL